MRNLKKLLAVILTVVMIASMMVPALAANTYEDEALKLQAINVFAGGPEDLKLDEGVTRIQGLTFAIRAAGKDAEALAMDTAEVDAILADWTDADSIPAWGRKYAAYAIKNSITVGLSSTEKIFGALNPISGTSFLVFIMKAGMGYADVTTATVVEASVNAGILTAGQAAGFGANEALIRDDAAGILFGAFTTGVNADGTKLIDAYIASGATTAADAAAAGFTSSAALSVLSIEATSAKTFLVKFNKAVTDDDKVSFKVARGTVETSVTVSWNEAKTEATLSSASNLPEATFTVSALKDGAEIAKQDITITAQKIARIEFTSSSVSVELTGNKNGYVTYKVYDQYGNDITTTYLANNMTFSSGAGNATGKNGLITIAPAGGPPLIQFPQISIIAYDASSGVSATATLPTSNAVGTLSDFVFGSAEDLKLSEGDVTSVFYLPYTATDISGNETKNYDLVKGGLILETGDKLVVSMPANVEAKLVRDPANTSNAAIEVKVIAGGPELSMDMPVMITAMTYTGKTSTVQTTLAKSKVLDSIILLAPAETVAVGERPEIGFEAYDQYGNKITKHSDIFGKLSPTGFEIQKKVNGDAKFVMNTAVKGINTLTAVVDKTGKMSTLNINVQETAVPSRIAINPKDIVNAMEYQATQDLVIGEDADEEIWIYDQYDRRMSDNDITTKVFNNNYKVVVKNANEIIKIAGTNNSKDYTAIGKVTIKADKKPDKEAGGPDTLTFELIKVDGTNETLVDAVSLNMTVIKSSDIKSYTISTFDKPIYTSISEGPGGNTDKEKAYAAEVKIYGRTGSGAQVLLAGNPVDSAYLTNDGNFNVDVGEKAYNSVKVTAKELPTGVSSAETIVTVNVIGHDGSITPLTTTVTSSTTGPVVTNIGTKGTSDDKATVAIDNIIGKYVVLYDEGGNSTEAASTRAAVYFEVTDSYGKKAMLPSALYVSVKDKNGGAKNATIKNGKVEYDTTTDPTKVPEAGDIVTITAITNNGLKKVMEITLTENPTP